MLRCHPPPNERKLADLEQFAREQGLEVDASSAAALHRSLARLRESHRDGYEIVQQPPPPTASKKPPATPSGRGLFQENGLGRTPFQAR